MWREGADKSLIEGAEEMADSNTNELGVVLKRAEGVWRSLWPLGNLPKAARIIASPTVVTSSPNGVALPSREYTGRA